MISHVLESSAALRTAKRGASTSSVRSLRFMCGAAAAMWAHCVCGSAAAQAVDFMLVDAGMPAVSVHAPGANQWSGERLASRVLDLTGVTLPVSTAAGAPTGSGSFIAVGTPATSIVVQQVLQSDPRVATLGEEGYILKVAQWNGRTVLVAAGTTTAGAGNAVSELVSWRLQLGTSSASVPAALNLSEKPTLKYRILWTWPGWTTWAASVEEMHASYEPGWGPTSCLAQGEAGYLTHYKRALDYFCDHKFNAMIIWHWLDVRIGGEHGANQILPYAKQRNIRILPGIGTIVYGGFVLNGDSPWSTDYRLRTHPEQMRCIDYGGNTLELPSSADPVHRQWLADGANWLFSTFPDIGGANLEHGDFYACYNPEAIAERAKPENDPNNFWDMMITQKPVLDVANQLQPGAWMTFATYCGFQPQDIVNARYEGPNGVYPPKFLFQYPSNAICQWTLSYMATPQAWPAGLHVPAANFADHIGLLHDGSGMDPGHWWALEGQGGRGASLDDASRVFQFVCGRMPAAGLNGLVLLGQIGAVSPANDLSYIAAEYFTWHPERTYDQFIQDRLTVAYGGLTRAQLFLTLLDNSSRVVGAVEADQQQALMTAQAPDLDVRQRTRWVNLAAELTRRANLLKETKCYDGLDNDGNGLTDCADPNCQQELLCQADFVIVPTSAQDGPVFGSLIEPDSATAFWGAYQGAPLCEVGIHTLPAGVRGADVKNAVLRIPATDGAWSADEGALNLTMLLKHIAAASPVTISVSDQSSAPLGTLGVYRQPGPYIADNLRYVDFDVTAALGADLNARRSTFAWRIEPQTIPAGLHSYRFFPTVDHTDTEAYGDNRGAKLFVAMVEGREWSCSNGIDDDGDGRSDCADPDCGWLLACRHPDFDRDGDVDQGDFAHLQTCFSAGYPVPIRPDCEDANLNDDPQVDVLDFRIVLKCFSGRDNPVTAGCMTAP